MKRKYRMILVVDVEAEEDMELSDAALLARKDRVIKTMVTAVRHGIATILNVKDKQIGILDFNAQFGEALPKPDRHLGALEN